MYSYDILAIPEYREKFCYIPCNMRDEYRDYRDSDTVRKYIEAAFCEGKSPYDDQFSEKVFNFRN